MNIILLGPPGSGKGTQAQYICEKLNIIQISTGDILRKAIQKKTELGKAAEKTINDGKLVSDEIVIALVEKRLQEKDCANGYILDGFPRTIAQAKALKKAKIQINMIIEIMVDDEEIISRISGRRVHPASGRTYHIKFNPPKIPNQDDNTCEAIIQRKDDKEEVVRNRLNIYKQQTKPLTKYYKDLSLENNMQFFTVNGEQPLEVVKNEIIKLIT